jgi:uncharacterized protein with PIN domain
MEDSKWHKQVPERSGRLIMTDAERGRKNETTARSAIENQSTTIVTAHDEEIVCASCGFDLDESELSASKCSDCGQPLELKKSISIEATSVPAYRRFLGVKLHASKES